MRQILFLVLLLKAGWSSACDFCGCNPSTAMWEQDAGMPSSFVQHSQFLKTVRFQDPENSLRKSLVWGHLLTGAYSPVQKLEIKGILPVLMISNSFSENNRSNQFGLGDALLQLQYLAWESKPSDKRFSGHMLSVNAGIELPTGSYAISEDPLLSNIAFGSKSIDFQIGGIYKISKFRWSFTAGSTARINNANRDDVRLGHLWSTFVNGTYALSEQKVAWRASIGSRTDYTSRNVFRSIYQNKTGGTVWQMTAGLNGSTRQWSWGVQYLQPVFQKNGMDVFEHRSAIQTTIQYKFKK